MTDQINCEICNTSKTHVLLSKFGQNISKCDNCGLVFVNPRQSKTEILSRYSPEYFWKEYLPAHGVKNGKYDPVRFDKKYKHLLSIINEYFNYKGKMLEIGTGAGFFLKAAERAGWKVEGIEISNDAVQFAVDELRLDVKQLFAEELEKINNKYDVIVMIEVIEHLFEPRKVLENINSKLNPGGIVLITTPNLNALSYIILGNEWAVLSPGEHLYYFTENTLRAILEKTNYQEITFIRKQSARNVFEAMNPRDTHYPKSIRTRFYWTITRILGPLIYRIIRDKGRSDSLLCIAQK